MLHQSFSEACGLQPPRPLTVLFTLRLYSAERCGSAHAVPASLQSIQHLLKRNKKVDARIICASAEGVNQIHNRDETSERRQFSHGEDKIKVAPFLSSWLMKCFAVTLSSRYISDIPITPWLVKCRQKCAHILFQRQTDSVFPSSTHCCACIVDTGSLHTVAAPPTDVPSAGALKASLLA